MTDTPADDRSAAAVLDAAEATKAEQHPCHVCQRPASYISGGLWTCTKCMGREPTALQGVAQHWFPVLLAAAMCLQGCSLFRRDRAVDPPVPSSDATVTAFREHRQLYAQACREIAAKAVSNEPFKNDREFTDFHNAKSESSRKGAFQQHFDRIQAVLGEGRWSNEGVNLLFTQIADSLEASQ